MWSSYRLFGQIIDCVVKIWIVQSSYQLCDQVTDCVVKL